MMVVGPTGGAVGDPAEVEARVYFSYQAVEAISFHPPPG